MVSGTSIEGEGGGELEGEDGGVDDGLWILLELLSKVIGFEGLV
jgi:hypothetical protein